MGELMSGRRLELRRYTNRDEIFTQNEVKSYVPVMALQGRITTTYSDKKRKLSRPLRVAYWQQLAVTPMLAFCSKNILE